MTQNSGADISTILAAFLVRLSLQDATIFLILFLNVRSSIITNNTSGSNITNKVTPTSKFVSELSRTGIATTEISNNNITPSNVLSDFSTYGLNISCTAAIVMHVPISMY